MWHKGRDLKRVFTTTTASTTAIFTTTARRHDDGFYHEATKSRRYLKKRHDNNHAEDGPDRGFRELRGYDGANGGERFVSSRPARSGSGRYSGGPDGSGRRGIIGSNAAGVAVRWPLVRRYSLVKYRSCASPAFGASAGVRFGEPVCSSIISYRGGAER